MYVPALAARAPLGATYSATGMGEASIAAMISRMEVSSPPGVFMRRMTSRVSLGESSRNSRATYSDVAGPIAPSISRMTAFGAALAHEMGVAREMATSRAASENSPSAGAAEDARRPPRMIENE